MQAAFMLSQYVGLEFTRTQNAALLASLTPLVAALVLWGRTRARPRALTFAFLALALAGVSLVVCRGNPSAFLHDGVRSGDIFCLLAAIGFAVYTVGAGELPRLSPLRFTTLTSLTATVFFIGSAIVAGAAGYDTPPSVQNVWAATPAILYLAAGGTAIGMIAWNASAQRLGPANAALFSNVVPVVVFAIEIVRGYRPAALEIVGGGVALAAVTGNNLLVRTPREAPQLRRGGPSLVATDSAVLDAVPLAVPPGLDAGR
jgi:drug/metabolite transporter (DMT)-like permease